MSKKKYVKNKIKNIIFTFIILFFLFFISFFIYKKYFNKINNFITINGNGYLIKNTKNLEDSGITGKDYEVNYNYDQYYTFLNEKEKILYKQVLANIENLETTFIPVEEININNIEKVIESVNYDHPELFWLESKFSYKYTADNICRQIILNFNDLKDNYESNKQLFESKVNTIVTEANSYQTDYEKEIYVHDILIDNISYNSNAKYNQTAYSAIVNGSTVCSGYAKSFQYIMNKLGIITYLVVGEANNGSHAWNITKLDDGFYNVDVTWDDNYINNYYYFNKTDSDFSDHIRKDISTNLPSCISTTYQYKNDMQNKSNQNTTNAIKKEEKKTENEDINIDSSKEEIIEENKQDNTQEDQETTEDESTDENDEDNNDEDNNIEEDNVYE